MTNYKLTSFELTKTKNGKSMARFYAQDMASDELLNCVMWEEAIKNNAQLSVGAVISLDDAEHNKDFNNYNVKKITLIKEAKKGLSETEREEAFNKIISVVEEFKNDKLKTAIKDFLTENRKMIQVIPAAIKIHHNYIGGLARHILECMDFAKENFKNCIKTIDQELVIAGCIMHDIGKIYEYTLDIGTGAIGKDKDFQKAWINHIQWGFNWANNKELPELAHIIASHHGLREWNALVEPLTNEAQLVFLCDMLSSRLGAISVIELETLDEKSETQGVFKL